MIQHICIYIRIYTKKEKNNSKCYPEMLHLKTKKFDMLIMYYTDNEIIEYRYSHECCILNRLSLSSNNLCRGEFLLFLNYYTKTMNIVIKHIKFYLAQIKSIVLDTMMSGQTLHVSF